VRWRFLRWLAESGRCRIPAVNSSLCRRDLADLHRSCVRRMLAEFSFNPANLSR
jgi:hypothetical protein